MPKRRHCYNISAPGAGRDPSGSPAATKLGEYLFSGACTGQDPATGQLAQGADRQAVQAFKNLRELVEGSGFSTDDVLRVWVWLRDWSVQDAVGKPWLEMFPDPDNRPAAAFVAAADLPANQFLQIEIAARKGGGSRRSVSIPGATLGDAYPTISVKGDWYATGSLRGDRGESIPTQAERLHDRFRAALDAIGASPDSVAHVLSWYRSHSSREIQNTPFTKLFPMLGDRPNRHSVIRDLPDGIEITSEAMGVKGGMRVNYTMHGPRHGGIDGLWNSLPLGMAIADLVHSAGTMGRDPVTDANPPDPNQQAELALANTKHLMEAAGLSMADIGHMFVWYKDQAARDALNAPLQAFFPDPDDRPAWHVLQADLPGDMVVQVEVIAVRP